jgi:hypothetical protein
MAQRGLWSRREVLGIAAALPVMAGCGASSNAPTASSGTGVTAAQTTVAGRNVLLGRALLPSQFGGAPVGNAAFFVLDLETGANVFSGLTDSTGQYTALVNARSSIAVIVTGGPFRVSGISNPLLLGSAKDFNGVTDIACQAGVTAVNQRAIVARQLDGNRIQNLELGAALFSNSVNFFSAAEVTAAANRVRQLTNDGATPPA